MRKLVLMQTLLGLAGEELKEARFPCKHTRVFCTQLVKGLGAAMISVECKLKLNIF